MTLFHKITVPEQQRHKVFFVRNHEHCFLGIRQKTCEKSRYSVLEKSMLKGKLLRRKEAAANSVFIVSFPQPEDWRDAAFGNPDSTDIFFPYPPRDHNGREFVCPDAYWNEAVSEPEKLDAGEDHFRRHTAEILKKYVFRGCTVYDPACSTGEFIACMKEKFPFCRYSASDRSASMVRFARRKIPEAFVCDIARHDTGSRYDIILCRFINHEVIETDRAGAILKRITSLLNRNGKVIIFGHTPVALDVPEFAERNNMHLLMSMGRCCKPEGFFQYYVMENRQ